MIPSIDIHSNVAVYAQIANHVQFAISSGRLKPGDRLPSVRELSERLDVNPNTVAKSYRDLEIQGLLYTRRGTGVYVHEDAVLKCAEQCRKQIIGRVFQVVAEAKSAGMSRRELLSIANASLSIDAPPYGETPSSLVQMACSAK